MTPGLHYRVLVDAAPAWISAIRKRHGEDGQRLVLASIEACLDRMGIARAVAIEDPTAPGHFTAIGERSSGALKPSEGNVRILKFEEVESPPPGYEEPIPPALDGGLQPEELRTLRQALIAEENPRHLRGFAHTMTPALPIAASLLHAKANLLDGQTVRAKASHMQIAQAAAQAHETRDRVGIHRAADALVDASAGLGRDVEGMWRDLAARGWSYVVHDPARPKTPGAALRKQIADYQASRGLSDELVRDHARLAVCLAVAGDLKLDEMPSVLSAAASDIVRTVGPNVRLIDAARLREMIPPAARDGYVSPSALELALASMKPRWSKIESPREANRLWRELSNANPTETNAIRARIELERAKKTIERERWIQWYRRLRTAYPSPRIPGSSGATIVRSMKPSRLSP